MPTVQFIGPQKWIGVLAPGQALNMSTGILVQELPASANLSLTVCARAERTAPAVFAVGIRDVTLVTNTPPGGYNLNFRMVNTHATTALTSVLLSYCIIT
jgi:hypothetical protein